MRASAFRWWWVAGLVVLLATAPQLLIAQAPPSPPLKATLFFPNPPPDVVFHPTSPTTPVRIVLQLELENVSGGPVITTEGFSAREHWRRLFFTDPVGGTITNVGEASIHASSRVGHCFSRQRVLLRPTAIPVVPIEVLSGTPSPLLGAPTGLTATGSPTGGSLPAGTYFYKVTAFDSQGIETAASAETMASVMVMGSNNGSVFVSWAAPMAAVPGATAYRVYRGTASGAQNTFYVTTATSLLDTGAPGRFGMPPPFALEYVIEDARRFWDLSRGGSYTVNARIPLLTFDATPAAIIQDCDQFDTDVANVAATTGRHSFTIISNTLAFSIQNAAPTISDIPDQRTALNMPTDPIPFTVGDAETDPASLILSGRSSNQTLVPDANIVFGGSGTDRTVTITPAADQSGTATITITVSDGALTASDSFELTVSATPVKAKEKPKGGS